jgi:hypothetical protein
MKLQTRLADAIGTVLMVMAVLLVIGAVVWWIKS